MLRRGGRQSRRQPSAGGFIPIKLSGNLLWLQSDMGITLNTSTVSAWADQSGHANNATQGTQANQPTYVSSGGPNNKPYLSYPGAAGAQRLLGTSVFNQPLHVFIAARSTGSANAAYLFDGGGNNNAIFQNASAFTTVFFAGTTIPGPTLTSGSDCVYECFLSGASSFARLNGGSQSTGNPGTGSSAVPYGIGNFTSGGDAWGGRIYAVLAYGRQLSAAEALFARQYLYSLYGIAGA